MSQSKENAYVGSIDLLKFFLAIAIVILHCGEVYGGEDALLPMGGIAVEVFFIISGCLMCRTAQKDALESKKTLGEDTVYFLWKKVKSILVPYCVLVVIYLICWMYETGADLLLEEGKKAFLLKLLDYFPNIALVYMSGVMQDVHLINIAWYVSAMLLAMAVLYPLIRHFGKNYTLIVAPVSALFLMGFMYNAADGLYKGTNEFLVFMPQGLMRAFIALNLGCVAYELAEKLRSLLLTKLSKILLTVGALFLCLVLLFVMQYGERQSCYPLTLLMPLLIGILFSKQMAGDAFFQNSVCTYLGRSSMYIYLYHVAVRRILLVTEVTLNYTQALLIMLIGAFVMFVVTDLIEHAVHSLMKKHHWKLSRCFVQAADHAEDEKKQ